MDLIPWTTWSLALVGEDLFVASVGGGPLGARAQRIGRVEAYARLSEPERQAALARMRPPARGGAGLGKARVCFVASGEFVSVRRLGVGVRAWARASGEVRGSVEKLLPLNAQTAALGLVERSGADRGGAAGDASAPASGAASGGAVGQGFVLGMDDRVLQSLIAPIESAWGVRVDAALGWAHALLGLGVQNSERAIVLDESPPGVPVHHELRDGSIVRLNEPGHAPAQRAVAGGARVLAMPGVEIAGELASAAHRLDGHDVAIAGALSERVAPEWIVPLRGRRRSALSRWAAAAIAAGVGVALIVGGARIGEARSEAALERIRVASAEIEPALREAEARRARVEALGAALSQIDAAWSRRDAGVLEAYRSLVEFVPADGFVYRVSIDGDRVMLAGEAPRAVEVLERVEGSALFERASMRPPASVAERPGMESFEITAMRIRTPGGASAGAGASGDGAEGGR